MDQRALLLDRLSGFSGATSHLQANGEVNVSIGGHILVNGHTTLELKAGTDLDGSGKLTVQWADGQAYNAFGGSLKGALNVYQNGIPQQLKVLDDMAVQLRDEVNAIHETGFGLDGSTGMQFFVGDTAQSLKVNPLLTAASLAVADAAAEPGNSIIADRIAALKTGKVLSSDTETFNQYYNKAVTQLGLSIQQAKDYSKSQKLVTEAMETQRESVAGVNLDEEAVNLAKYQKAYAAAARVMTTYDELLDLIINRMGRVGL
jgi:flagellar hook-associated protein 1 FlgK